MVGVYDIARMKEDCVPAGDELFDGNKVSTNLVEFLRQYGEDGEQLLLTEAYTRNREAERGLSVNEIRSMADRLELAKIRSIFSPEQVTIYQMLRALYRDG
jgi:hypothetical protein